MALRVVPFGEKKKRGCKYCKDMKLTRDFTGIRTGCPHQECPYHALDSHDSYEEFMKSEDSRIHVQEFFQTMPSVYELANGNAQVRKIFSGSDDELHL
jgi:hypothetical protein